ncbi:MAG: hypothetical protein O2865_04090 [Planctomycetota bacterium]|nr:hypothetical protein [Planctomycetota bacterium]MDA1220737.1 hypothetical protein [Planctomycetota bacterium]
MLDLERAGATVLSAAVAASLLTAQQGPGTQGERLPAGAISPVVVESMDVVEARERAMVRPSTIRGQWYGQDGRWFVPPLGVTVATHSGEVAVANEWGDPRIGVRFGRLVDVERLFAAGHGTAPATRLDVIGYRGHQEVGRFSAPTLDPNTSRELAVALRGVDRIEFVAAEDGRIAFFAIDDLEFRSHGEASSVSTVLDFEDLGPRAQLTGSRYAGLVWETGTGLRAGRDGTLWVDAPQSPVDTSTGTALDEGPAAGAGTALAQPNLTHSFIGPRQGDPGGGWVPPDTCGTVGPDHFLSVTNANLSAWNKDSGQRVVNVGLDAFWGQTVGDPRAHWDSSMQRYVILATDFTRSRSIWVAVSATADPTGAWLKFSFQTDQGTDAGRWPDYPTLGFDRDGIYTAAYMVGSGARMTIWAIDKAWLQTPTPGTPSITAFRSLPWEGAIQPCATQTVTDPVYLVSRSSRTSLRLRRILWVLGNPVLTELGSVTVPNHSSPPGAPVLGANTPLSTIDYRPMNAVSRAGRVYTAQNVSANGMAAVRWYEIDASTRATLQVGTVTDPIWHYFYGSIAVDAAGNIGLGFSGSHAGSYGSAFVTARRATDPAGLTATPVQMKAGEGAYERVDSAGRNRWGDYSMIAVDPTDELGFWAIQEYAGTGNTWRTWIGRFAYEAVAYGDGLAGTTGVPTLTAGARPTLGASVPLVTSNSSGALSAPAVLLLGLGQDSSPQFGGTVLVQPNILEGFVIGPAGGQVSIPVPNDPAAVGASVYCQSIQLDAGATQGLAFTGGLEIIPATR